MAPRFLFCGQYIDKWGNLMTWSNYCYSEEDAMRRLKQWADSWSRKFEIDPHWTQVIYDDGAIVSRVDYEQSQLLQSAAE